MAEKNRRVEDRYQVLLNDELMIRPQFLAARDEKIIEIMGGEIFLTEIKPLTVECFENNYLAANTLREELAARPTQDDFDAMVAKVEKLETKISDVRSEHAEKLETETSDLISEYTFALKSEADKLQLANKKIEDLSAELEETKPKIKKSENQLEMVSISTHTISNQEQESKDHGATEPHFDRLKLTSIVQYVQVIRSGLGIGLENISQQMVPNVFCPGLPKVRRQFSSNQA
ncbi:hypothetical protein WAI453_012490 [Rhynchosporium graminicola]